MCIETLGRDAVCLEARESESLDISLATTLLDSLESEDEEEPFRVDLGKAEGPNVSALDREGEIYGSRARIGASAEVVG